MSCMTIMERIMTQMLETWTLHTVYLIINEVKHRKMANHHQSWYVIRLLFSTECLLVHITKNGPLPLCVL